MPRGTYALVAGLLCATLLSLVRVACAHTLRVDEDGLPLWAWGGLLFLFGLCSALAVRGQLRALADTDAPWPALLRAALLAHLAVALALPFTSNDVFSNLAYGRLWLTGHNPYLHGPSALAAADPFRAYVGARWQHTPIVYGPLIALLNPLCSRASSVPLALALYKLLMLSCSLAAVALAYHLGRSGRASRAGFVAFACSPLLCWELSGQAHNDAVMVLLLTAGLCAAARERPLLATLGLALAVYAKFTVAPVLLLYLCLLATRLRKRHLLLLLLLLALAGVILAAPFLGDPALWRTLRTATGVGQASRVVRSLLEPLNNLLGLVAPDLRQPLTRAWSLAALLSTGAVGLWSVGRVLRQRTLAAVVRGSILVLLTHLLTTPWFQNWYACWLLPLCLLEEDPAWRRLLVLVAAMHLCVYGLGITQATALCHLATLGLLWRLRRPRPGYVGAAGRLG